VLLQGLGLKVLDLAVPKLLKDPLKSNKTGCCGTFLTCRWLPFIVPIVEGKNNCTSLDADSAIIKAIKEARDDYVLQQLYEELYPKIRRSSSLLCRIRVARLKQLISFRMQL
jgi:hypothetical protein